MCFQKTKFRLHIEFVFYILLLLYLFIYILLELVCLTVHVTYHVSNQIRVSSCYRISEFRNYLKIKETNSLITTNY